MRISDWSSDVCSSDLPIRALPLIADAVGDRIEVVMDGGIRRGSDVVKAIGLGAKAVMIGRASLWALAVGGQPGVEHVLDVLRNRSEERSVGKEGVSPCRTRGSPYP